MSAQFDLTIRHGMVYTENGLQRLDIGVQGETIAALEPDLAPGKKDIDAGDRLVLPGGIDSHCHIEQMSGMGIMGADDFHSATVSAAFGGTTTVIPFAVQRKTESLIAVAADYAALALPKAVIDYAFHVIISDPTETVLRQELPQMVAQGITSFKVYMTYDAVKLDDYQLLEVLSAATEHGALIMAHAESNDMIRWMTTRLIERGLKAPKYHEVAHDPLAESEATHRAVSLARLAGAPLLIVHVGGIETVQVLHSAQAFGAPIYAETCPQYLFLTRENLDLPGLEGAKFCCAPPPRDPASQAAVWSGLANGTLSVFSSDHAPYTYDTAGKLPKGENTIFSEIANGVPGLETRMPLLFSEGVGKGRITLEKFVELTATNHAKTYGLYPRKGIIRVGSDADVCVWDTARSVTITASDLHDRVGYTPYEGMTVTGWPETTICRGNIVVSAGRLVAGAGDGRFLPCGPSQLAAEAGSRYAAMPDAARRGLLFKKIF
jgi:dihydropyrimidinase